MVGGDYGVEKLPTEAMMPQTGLTVEDEPFRAVPSSLMLLCISLPGGEAQSASLQADLAGASYTLKEHH